MTPRKRTVLEPANTERESRQELVFNADGPLVASRFPQGRWPLFTGGDIFEVWTSLVQPSPVQLTLSMFRFKASRPRSEDAIPLQSFVIPVNSYVHAFTCQHDIDRSDQVTFALQVPEIPEGLTPGSGLMAIARVS